MVRYDLAPVTSPQRLDWNIHDLLAEVPRVYLRPLSMAVVLWRMLRREAATISTPQ